MGRTRIETIEGKTAEALDDERVELRIQLAVMRDRRDDPAELAALATRIDQLDQRIKRLREAERKRVR